MRTYLKTKKEPTIRFTKELENRLFSFGMFVLHILIDTDLKSFVDDKGGYGCYSIHFCTDSRKWFNYLQNDNDNYKFNLPMDEFAQYLLDICNEYKHKHQFKYIDFEINPKTKQPNCYQARQELIENIYELYKSDKRGIK
tara:strand:+ start:346 stop:765 length:420 start_codon:yes stop_codon:yes gene_type:complete